MDKKEARQSEPSKFDTRNNYMKSNKNTITYADTLKRLQDLRDNQGLSLSDMEKESGISSGRLSNFFNQNYKGDQTKLLNDVHLYVTTRDERLKISSQVPDAPKFVETPTAASIKLNLSYAHSLQKMSLVSAGAGVGKTSAVKDYAETRNGVFRVTISPSSASVMPMLVSILTVLGEANATGRPQLLSDKIISMLRNTNGLLIVDEAQHLKPEAIEELRHIHDVAEVGIALVGNSDLFARFSTISEGSMHEQVRSRIAFWLSRPKPTLKDVQALALGWHIKDAKMVEYLMKIASRKGALRSVSNTLMLAKMVSEGNDIDLASIKSASASLQADGRAV